jgi:hypothetical protein
VKTLLLALALVAALGVAACGGGGNNGPAGPLALDQRVPSEEDAPDSKPDPVEERVTVKSTDGFISKLGEHFINPTAKEVADFESSDFVEAIHDTRFFPAEPGGPHRRDAPHLFSLVMQFESPKGAQDALDFFHTDSVRPCPESCATQVEEFDVDIPGGYGVRRFATEENIEATGDEGHPYDSYEIGFADGLFAYRVTLNGPPGKVSQDEAEDIVKSLYDRVAGAPAKT